MAPSTTEKQSRRPSPDCTEASSGSVRSVALGSEGPVTTDPLCGRHEHLGTNTLAGRKQGVRLAPTWAALQHRGSGATVDRDALAIGEKRQPVECRGRRALLQPVL